MTFVQRHTVRECDDYLFQIDEYMVDGQQVCFAHHRFSNFTPATLKKAMREWRLLRTVVTCPLLAFGEEQGEKWEAFVRLFGFEPTDQHIDCNNGERRRLFISTVKELPNERRHQTATKYEPDPEHRHGSVGSDAARADIGNSAAPRRAVHLAG